MNQLLPTHGGLDEPSPPKGSGQRWRERRSLWIANASDAETFDPGRYQVSEIAEQAAKDFIVTHHYSATYPAASRRYGLFDTRHPTESLVGVAVFSVPAQARVLTNVFPRLEPYRESLELGRFCLLGLPHSHKYRRTGGTPQTPGANAESWFLARCLRSLREAGVKGVVSFSDPVPRVIAGTVTFPGHVGIIYQASNAVYLGRGTARSLVVLPDGSTLSDRSLQKVRAQERGHEYVERRLIGFGATAPKALENPRTWLPEALEEAGALRLRHRGNHRYALTTCKASKRELVRRQAAQAYPKRPD